MKQKLYRKIRSAKYYGFVTALSSGLFTIIALVCLCGLGISRLGIPEYAVYAALCFALGMGGYISGHTLGKINRRGGLASGVKCGTALFIIVTVFGIIYLRGIAFVPILRNFVFIFVPAVVGGVAGVNSKSYKAPYS